MRVGVIGTGSSGIQAISIVVFQRTANFSIPAWNRPLSIQEQKAWKANCAQHREKARDTRSGILYEHSARATTDVDERARQAERRSRPP